MKTKFTFGLFFFINLFFAQTLTKINPSNPNTTFGFGGYASAHENIVVTSSLFNNNPPYSESKIHVFDISVSINNETQIITSPENGQFITPTTCVFEDKLFISSTGNSTNVANGGAVYYYKKIGNQWLYQSKIQPTNQTENDKFGSNLEFKNNQLFVTASGYEDDTLPTTSANGGIYIYNFNNDIFTLNQILTTSINTSFGRLLDIENETLVTISGNGSNSCTIFTYKKTNQNWSLVNTFPLTVPGESPYNQDLLGSINYTNNQLFIFYCSAPPALSPLLGEIKIYDLNISNNWVYNSSIPFQPNDFFNAYLNVTGDKMVLTGYGFYMLQMERKNPAWYYKKINGTWTFQSTYASYSVYINDGFSFKNSIGNSKILFCAPYERSTQPHPFVPSIPNGGLYYIDTALSNSEFEKDKLVIYPNPVENLLQIQNTNTIQINKLQVYDAFGRNMISLDSTFENIDTRNLSSGIYLLEITFQNNTKKTVKFIKK
jgi:hypothetical protein